MKYSSKTILLQKLNNIIKYLEIPNLIKKVISFSKFLNIFI